MRLSSTLSLALPSTWRWNRADGRSNTGPEVDAVKAALDLGVIKVPPEVEGPRAEG